MVRLVKYRGPLLMVVVAVAALCLVVVVQQLEVRGGTAKSSIECRWQFSHYEPSAYEELWAANISKWQEVVCETLARPEHAHKSELIVGRVKRLTNIDSTVHWPPDLPEPKLSSLSGSFANHPGDQEADGLMSRMHYRKECQRQPTQDQWEVVPGASGVQLIEPLWGMLRDPFDIYCHEYALHKEGWTPGRQSKSHILAQGYAPYRLTNGDDYADDDVAPWRSHGIPPWHSWNDGHQRARRVLLDLGSSFFARWGTKEKAGSGRWFYDMYHKRGQPFDRFIAVESSPLPVAEAYRQLPQDLVAVYTLINLPVSLTDQSDQVNCVRLIKALVQPNDFFVVKVDIDSPALERGLVGLLLEDAELRELVDELMFEHHVKVKPMIPHWGAELGEDMADSHKLFSHLRQAGIRAHSWP